MSRKVNIFNASCQDADVLAFMAAAGINDSTILNGVCTLVNTFKTSGIWEKKIAIYCFVGGTATTHKFNLKDPRDLDAAFRLSFIGGGTHSSNGWLPNGINGFANTFITPSTHLSNVNSTSLSFYSRTNSTAGFHDIGNNSSGNFALSAYYAGIGKLIVSYLYPTHSVLGAGTNTLGMIAGSRTANNVLKLFYNGALLGTNTTIRTSNLPNVPLYIGATNVSGVAGFFSNRQCAYASIGGGLTDAENLIEYNAVQAFQISQGRQV